MQFFRKHFVTVALVLVALAAIALILPRFFSNESNRVQEIEITPQDIDFTRDGELSIFKNDSLIQTIEVESLPEPAGIHMAAHRLNVPLFNGRTSRNVVYFSRRSSSFFLYEKY